MAKVEIKIKLNNISDEQLDEFEYELEQLFNRMNLDWETDTRHILSGEERKQVIEAIRKAAKEGKVHIEDGALD